MVGRGGIPADLADSGLHYGVSWRWGGGQPHQALPGPLEGDSGSSRAVDTGDTIPI